MWAFLGNLDGLNKFEQFRALSEKQKREVARIVDICFRNFLHVQWKHRERVLGRTEVVPRTDGLRGGFQLVRDLPLHRPPPLATQLQLQHAQQSTADLLLANSPTIRETSSSATILLV